MNTIIAILTVIWFFLNFCLIGLLCYIRWLQSEKHMTLFEHKVDRIKRKFEKMQKG